MITFFNKTATYYVKLQEAYYSEKNQMGGWDMIGYTAPGSSGTHNNGSGYTTNFTYTGGTTKGNSSWEPSTFTSGWTAANRGKLNDCTTGSWDIKAKIDGGKDSYQATVTGTGCDALTPNFSAIGH